jgi:agmatine deiminase
MAVFLSVHSSAAGENGAYRMPAEWEPHEACLMAWPVREKFWDPYFERAKDEHAAAANAIAAFEPVVMVTNPGQAAEVKQRCSARVRTLEVPIDDSWTRDSGPLFVVDEDGHRAGVDFVFNSWGERFIPYDKDAAMAARVLELLGIERIASPMVLEGGSLTVDGEGTLITTEQCLLNPNRNPDLSRDEIEAELRRTLGVEKVIWLPWGHAGDKYTDGHVDGVCAFVRPGAVLAHTCTDPDNPNYELMAANLEVLRSSTDAAGRRLEVIELSQWPYFDLDGESLAVSYVNAYVANGGVVVPVAEHPLDGEALETLGEAFPDHEVVGVPARIVRYGGGGTHCITQQIPAGRAA